MSDSFDLDSVPWAHQTPTLGALGFRFAVRVADPALGAYLDHLLASLQVEGDPRFVYSMVERHDLTDRPFRVHLGDEQLSMTSSPAGMVAYLIWHVNRLVVEHSSHYLLIHASGVEDRGAAAILAAPSGSGKTTLAAGLVRSGLRYLTDEAVAIDPATTQIVPYPKVLAIGPGAWSALADLAPRSSVNVGQAVDKWHVPPDDIRPGAVAPTCRARLVIAPRYERGGPTRLQPINRAEGVVVLAENAFNLRAHGHDGLGVLRDVVATCDCYRLAVGDLDTACRIVTDLLGDLQ